MKKTLAILALTSFQSAAMAQGFESSSDAHNRQPSSLYKGELERLGKVYWVYQNRKNCNGVLGVSIDNSPDMMSRNEYKSPNPIKIEIKELVLYAGIIPRYKVLVDDAHEAFMSTSNIYHDEPSIFEINNGCMLPLSPSEVETKIKYENDKEKAKLIEEEKTIQRLEAAAAAERAQQEALARKPPARIGMSTKQVRSKTSWGEPLRINTTITARGTSEQWIYGDSQYLYFLNGKLYAIQN